MNSFPQQMLFQVTPDDPRVERLVGLLTFHGWLKRQQIAELLAWDERTIRSVASAARELIVRGQRGFNLTSVATLDELNQCATQRINQGKEDLETGLIWQRIAHQRVGSKLQMDADEHRLGTTK